MLRPYLSAAAVLVFLVGCNAEIASEADDTDAMAVDGESDWCALTQNYEPIGECERFERQYATLAAGVDAFKPDEKMVAGKTTVVSYAITRLPDSVQGEGGEIADPVGVAPNDDSPEPSEAADNAYEGEAGLGAGVTEGPTQAEIDAALDAAAREASEAVVANAEADAVTTGQIKMARFMYACLSGDPTFTIEPATCQSLDTLESPQPVWRWRVTPIEPGERRKLQLTSGVEVRARDGSTRRIGQATRRAEIDVTVTRLGRFKMWMAEAEEWIRSPLGVIAALTALVGAIGLLIGAVRRARKGEGPTPAEPKG